MEGLAAHIRRRLVGYPDGQQHLAVEAAFAHRVVAVVGAVDRLVRPHMDAMRAIEETLAPGAQKFAVAVEDDHRVLAAIEDVDIVLGVDADPRNFLQRPAIGQSSPPIGNAIAEPTGSEHNRHGMTSRCAPDGVAPVTLYQPVAGNN